MKASSLMSSVLEAVTTLGLTGIPGFLAGIYGNLDQEFLQKLAWFKVTFLAPSLIISSLGARLSIERLLRVLPLSFWSCTQLGTGFVVSRMMARLCRSTTWAPQKSVQDVALLRLLQVAIVFQNIGAYNIPLLRSMCSTSGLFPEHSEHCFDDGILMIFGYHLPFDLAMWTVGYASVQAIKNAEKDSDCSDAENSAEELPVKQLEARLEGSVIINTVKSCLNPVVTAMFLGMVIGLTPMLHSMFFTREGAFRVVGESLKRLGEAVPVISLQILTATLGGATRKFFEILRMQKKVHDESRPVSAGAEHGVSHGWWMAAVILGKLVLLPACGFAIFMALGRVQQSIQQPPLALESKVQTSLQSGSAIPGDSMPSTYFPSALGEFLWPNDKLFRAVVVMQWSAPSCLTLIVLCHRVGLDQNTVQAVAGLYLIMYALAATATTFWVTIGLAIF